MLKKFALFMFLSSPVIAADDPLQTLKEDVNSFPEFSGRSVKACYDERCIEFIAGAQVFGDLLVPKNGPFGSGGFDSPPIIETPPKEDIPDAKPDGGTAGIIRGVMGGLIKSGAIKADAKVVVDYVHEVKNADGSSETHKVHVEVGGSVATGAGAAPSAQ